MVAWGSNPVQVFNGNPFAPGAVDVTPVGIVIYTPSGAGLSQPLSTSSTPVRWSAGAPSITIPAMTVPANSSLYVVVHFRYNLLGLTGWPNNAQTTFAQGYRFNANWTVNNSALTNMNRACLRKARGKPC